VVAIAGNYQGDYMLIRDGRELGELVLDGRRRLGWSQSELAKRVGASRYWVSEFENGKVTVEVGLVLSALSELGYGVHVERRDSGGAASGAVAPLYQPRGGGLVRERPLLTRGGKPLRVRRGLSGSGGGDGS
jgi:transcriptional regulator with XRE-family HTH domain